MRNSGMGLNGEYRSIFGKSLKSGSVTDRGFREPTIEPEGLQTISLVSLKLWRKNFRNESKRSE
jgi:hypothetical protein